MRAISSPSTRRRGAALRALWRFGPPLAVMAVIFALSAQPDLNSGLGVWDTILRKLGHAAEYGLLWWLWRRALGHRHALTAAAITLAYAASDELHQSFVTGRHGSPRDWLIDAAGVALAMVAVAVMARRRSE
jgi:VanZ family protein